MKLNKAYVKRFVPQIIDLLASTNSRIDKEEILFANKDFEDLKYVLYATYNPYINYYIQKIPSYNKTGGHTEIRKACQDIIRVLNGREKTGHAGINYLSLVLEDLDESHAEILERVIQRDLRCGISVKTINKVFGKDFIPEFKVMLADKVTEKTMKNIEFPAHISTKIDGGRINLIGDGKTVKAYSRNGKELETHGIFDHLKFDGILDGEAVFTDDSGLLLLRKKSNGFFNKMVRNTITPEEVSKIKIFLFDFIQSDDVDYSTRLMRLENYIKPLNDERLEVVEYQLVNSWEGAQNYYKSKLNNGEEGAIIRNMFDKWEGKRCKSMLKMKNELTCELKIDEIIEGSGKYEGFLGNFIASSACGKLSVSVGSGLSDKQRVNYYNIGMIGKIITVKYNDVICDEKGNNSLFLPIFIEVRDDKDEADKLCKLLDNC